MAELHVNYCTFVDWSNTKTRNKTLGNSTENKLYTNVHSAHKDSLRSVCVLIVHYGGHRFQSTLDLSTENSQWSNAHAKVEEGYW